VFGLSEDSDEELSLFSCHVCCGNNAVCPRLKSEATGDFSLVNIRLRHVHWFVVLKEFKVQWFGQTLRILQLRRNVTLS
jgi:hypothetical protein